MEDDVDGGSAGVAVGNSTDQLEAVGNGMGHRLPLNLLRDSKGSLDEVFSQSVSISVVCRAQ